MYPWIMLEGLQIADFVANYNRNFRC
jgi:hypothetical protein